MQDAQATAGVSADPVFETRMALRWADQDALGHVNNVTYFRYFEEARVRLLARLRASSAHERYWLVAHASCDFLRPLQYPGELIVGLSLSRIGRTSLTLGGWIALATQPETACARARMVVVGADGPLGRPVPWSEADRAAIRQGFTA